MVTHSYNVPGTDVLFLTLAQAKLQLKIEDSFMVDNALINDGIASAQAECENYCGIALARRNFIMEANNFDAVLFQMNYTNDAIEEIEYYDEANELQTLSVDNYKLRNSVNAGCFEIKFTDAPAVFKRDDAVKITVNQGWTVNAVPTPVKQAMKLLIADYYERREERSADFVNTRAHSLLRPYKRY